MADSVVRNVDPQELETYQNDGIVCLRGMFEASWVERMQQAAEISLANPGSLHAELAKERSEAGRFFHDTFVWQRNEACRNFVFGSPAATLAKQLLESKKVNIFFDQWLIKEPGTSTKTPWHHDMTYWPINGDQICTLWLALDPITEKNGAVEYIKGSHRWGQKYRPVAFGSGHRYTEKIPTVPNIEAEREKHNIISFELEPGDCTVHHGLTVHGSPGNQSNQTRRRAHVSRWVGDDVTFNPRPGLQEMPPYPPELKPGDALDSELWPLVLSCA